MFLTNINCIIVCISNNIMINGQGLYQCDNQIFCETTLVLHKDISIPSNIILGDKYVDGNFIHLEPPEPLPEE